MTFDELWPTLPIPAEYDSMDETDQTMWRLALRTAYEGGRKAVIHELSTATRDQP